MKMIAARIAAMTLAVLTLFSASAYATERDEAVKMVKSAVAYYRTHGMEKALDAYSDLKGPFVKGELYVAALSLDGTLLAKGMGQNMIGQNTIDVPDPKGKKFRREMIEGAIKNGSGWVDYVFLNPKTRELENKESYYEKADDMVITVGIYKGK